MSWPLCWAGMSPPMTAMNVLLHPEPRGGPVPILRRESLLTKSLSYYTLYRCSQKVSAWSKQEESLR